MNREELKKQIKQVNDLTDQKTVAKLKEQISWLNLNDPNNKEIFELSRLLINK